MIKDNSIFSDLCEREKLALEVAQEFEKKIGDNLYNVLFYGSALSELSFTSSSDYDFIIVLTFFDFEVSELIRETRVQIQNKYKIKIGLSIHEIKDFPSTNKKDFFHNYRGGLILYEIKSGNIKTLLQKNRKIFSEDLLPENEYIKDESINLLRSYIYNTRKILLKENLTNDICHTIVKQVIYSAKYISAYFGYYPLSLGRSIQESFRLIPEIRDDYLYFLDKKEKKDYDGMCYFIVQKAYKYFEKCVNKMSE